MGVPRIAQSTLEKAVLTVQGIAVTDATSSSVRMAVNSTITAPGGISAVINPFVGDFYLQDLNPHKSFASLNLPATRNVKLQTMNISQEMPIEDMDMFTDFSTWLGNRSDFQL